MRRRARIAAAGTVIAGVMTLVSVVVMMTRSATVEPFEQTNEPGFKTAMIWFELSASPKEVFDILGPADSTEGQQIRTALDTQNHYDFFFLSCYSLYNACLIWFVTRLNTYRFNKLLKIRAFFVLGIVLAAGMFVGDIIENLRLLDITQAKSPGDISTIDLESLQYWTRIKWGSIAAVSLMLSVAYASYFRRIPPLLMSVAYATAGISCFIGISVLDARWFVESITTPGITVAWILSLIHAISVWIYGPRPNPPLESPTV